MLDSEIGKAEPNVASNYATAGLRTGWLSEEETLLIIIWAKQMSQSDKNIWKLS